MDDATWLLLGTAVSIGFFHTLIGLDHTLPFVVLGRAQGWPLRRVLAITFLCGLVHVLSSVVLGALGIGLGVALERLEWIESSRGDLAAWLLIVFGLSYAAWSFSRGRRQGEHAHVHGDGTVHLHEHPEGAPHGHLDPAAASARLTAWSLFVIFVLGPCEPLIPLLMVPAMRGGVAPAALVATAFGVTTIATMMALVALGYLGLGVPVFRRLEPHAHTMAGLAIASSGVAIRVLGI